MLYNNQTETQTANFGTLELVDSVNPFDSHKVEHDSTYSVDIYLNNGEYVAIKGNVNHTVLTARDFFEMAM